MEELAKLEAERGNPEYLEEENGGRDVRGERGSREQQYAQESSMGKGASRAAERELRRRPGGQRSPAGGFAKTEIASKENLPHQGNDNRGRRASNEMCIFLILNISSLQLIPVNMIAYRSQYGSANPTAIIAPAIAATLVSTLVAIVYCKIKDHSARSGMGRSRMGGNGMGQNHKGSRADLTASEIRRISGSGVGSLRPDTDVRMLWGRRKDKGGKAV